MFSANYSHMVAVLSIQELHIIVLLTIFTCIIYIALSLKHTAHKLHISDSIDNSYMHLCILDRGVARILTKGDKIERSCAKRMKIFKCKPHPLIKSHEIGY